MKLIEGIGEGEVLLALTAAGRAADRLRPVPSPFGTNLLFTAERVGSPPTFVKVYRSAKAAARESAALRLARPLARASLAPTIVSEFEIDAAGVAISVAELSLLPGAPPRRDVHGDACDLAELGSTLARLHHVPVPPRFGDLSRGDHPAWEEVLSARLERGRRLVGDGLVPEAALAAVRNRFAEFGPGRAEQPSLLHADLNPSNVIVAPGGSWAVVDFERAFLGHWLYDLVKLFRSGLVGCGRCHHSFFEGYGSMLSSEEWALFEIYDAIYCLDMAAYLARVGRSPRDRRDLEELVAFLRDWPGAASPPRRMP